jgi:hypothetical protein
VHDHGDVGWHYAFGEELFQRFNHSERRIARHGRYLCPLQRAAHLIESDKVGECAAGVDANEPFRHANGLFTHF